MSRKSSTGLTASRRGFFYSAAAVAVGMALPMLASAESNEPIKIGLVLAKQGAMAEQSQYIAQGTFLALEQQGNKILGRPAEIIWLDEPTPLAAQQNMQKLIDEDKVVAVLGGGISANALALSALAKRAKIPYVANNAAATDITGKECNRYTFRVQAPVPVQARALAPYLSELGDRWYFLAASYAFGQDIVHSFDALAKQAGATVVGQDLVPLNTPDYSSYILKIRQAKPDVVVGGLAAADISTFLKQWNEMGMKGKIPFAEIAIGDTDIWAVGPTAASGIFTKPWYYNDANNSPESKAFADAYQAKYNRPAADKAWMGWFAARSLLESIEQAGSTDPAAIVQAMEKWQGKEGDLPVYYRPWDHQMIRPMIVVGVKPEIKDKSDFFDVLKTVPGTAAELEAMFGTQAEIGCSMGEL